MGNDDVLSIILSTVRLQKGTAPGKPKEAKEARTFKALGPRRKMYLTGGDEVGRNECTM